jgi:hypothetical protein
MHVLCPRTSAQEVYSTSPKFPCAGSREKKPNASFFYQPVDFVEKDRQSLDFVDDDYFVSRIDLLRDAAWILA